MTQFTDSTYLTYENEFFDSDGEDIVTLERWLEDMASNNTTKVQVNAMKNMLQVLRLCDVSANQEKIQKMFERLKEFSQLPLEIAEQCLKCVKTLFITYKHITYFKKFLDEIVMPEVINCFWIYELCDLSTHVLLELMDHRLLSPIVISEIVVPGAYSYIANYDYYTSTKAYQVDTGAKRTLFEAAYIVVKVIDQLERFPNHWLANEFLPRFSSMLGDKDVSVRKICVQAFKKLCYYMGLSFTEQCLCPHIIVALKDSDWNLRRTACEVFVDVARNVSPDFKKKVLVRHYVNMVSDLNECVSQIALSQMGFFLETFEDYNGGVKEDQSEMEDKLPVDFLISTGLTIRFFTPSNKINIREFKKYRQFGVNVDDSFEDSVVDECSELKQNLENIFDDEKLFKEYCDNQLVYDDEMNEDAGVFCNLDLNNGNDIEDKNITIANKEIIPIEEDIIEELVNDLIDKVAMEDPNNGNYFRLLNDEVDSGLELELKDENSPEVVDRNILELESNNVEEYAEFLECFGQEERDGCSRSSGYFNTELNVTNSFVDVVSPGTPTSDTSEMDISEMGSATDDEGDDIMSIFHRTSSVLKHLSKEDVTKISHFDQSKLPFALLRLYIEIENYCTAANGSYLQTCAETLPQVLYIIGGSNWPILKGIFFYLLHDCEDKVTHYLAANIGRLAEAIDPIYEEDLITAYNMMKDKNYDIQYPLISNISQFIHALTPNGRISVCKTIHVFGYKYLEGENRYKWRIRDVYLRECCKLVDAISIHHINEFLVPSVMTLAVETVAQIRHSATDLLARIFDKFIVKENELAGQNSESCTDSSDMPLTDSLFRDMRHSFLKSRDWRRRQVFMKFCEFALESKSIPSEYIRMVMWPFVAELGKDPVVNVRVILARLMQKAQTLPWMVNADLRKDVERSLNSLHLFELDPQLKSEIRTTSNTSMDDEWSFLKERQDRIYFNQDRFQEHIELLKCNITSSLTDEINATKDDSTIDISIGSDA
uniref:Condensin complex subunit 1 n=1 Tax=Rhabditophanes sp. KR3021 TaxID=114890 RepID=A0AC35TSY6_9BILA